MSVFQNRKLVLLLCAVAAIQTMGCSTFKGAHKDKGTDDGFNPLKKLSGEKEPEYQNPSSMVAIWKASVFEKPGQKSIRGFGGRFYFYDSRNLPVRVLGDLTIYGYDDANKGETIDGKADRKFVFKSESLESHYSESALGESYSFWVPWEEVGGFEKTITLIPVFKTVDGRVPEAKPSTIRLPGKRLPKNFAAAEKKDGVMAASGVVPERSMIRQAEFINGDAENKSRRAPTTLRLSQRLADQVAQPKPAKSQNDTSSKAVDLKAAAKPLPTQTSSRSPRTSKVPANPPRTNVFGQPGSFR